MLSAVGLCEARITHRYDTFRGTTKEAIARKYGVHGGNAFARRP